MFDLSPEKIFVLVLAALFVLGPERLPAAATWLGATLRKAKVLAANANAQIRSEIGPDLDRLAEPLAQLRTPLQELRGLRDPRASVVRHLLGDDGVAAAAPSTAPAGSERAVADEVPVVDVDATRPHRGGTL